MRFASRPVFCGKTSFNRESDTGEKYVKDLSNQLQNRNYLTNKGFYVNEGKLLIFLLLVRVCNNVAQCRVTSILLLL